MSNECNYDVYDDSVKGHAGVQMHYHPEEGEMTVGDQVQFVVEGGGRTYASWVVVEECNDPETKGVTYLSAQVFLQTASGNYSWIIKNATYGVLAQGQVKVKAL